MLQAFGILVAMVVGLTTAHIIGHTGADVSQALEMALNVR